MRVAGAGGALQRGGERVPLARAVGGLTAGGLLGRGGGRVGQQQVEGPGRPPGRDAALVQEGEQRLHQVEVVLPRRPGRHRRAGQRGVFEQHLDVRGEDAHEPVAPAVGPGGARSTVPSRSSRTAACSSAVLRT